MTRIINYLGDNWFFIVLIIDIIISFITFVVGFFKSSVDNKKEKIMAWLVFACEKAENELSSGSGKEKLNMVYNMFIEKFPFISKLVSFEKFSNWVEIILEKNKK